MTGANKSGAPRKLDATGLLLLAAVGVAAVGGGAGLIYEGYFTPWEFVVFLLVGVAFVAVGVCPATRRRRRKNTLAHGAARPACRTGGAGRRARRGQSARACTIRQFPD